MTDSLSINININGQPQTGGSSEKTTADSIPSSSDMTTEQKLVSMETPMSRFLASNDGGQEMMATTDRVSLGPASGSVSTVMLEVGIASMLGGVFQETTADKQEKTLAKGLARINKGNNIFVLHDRDLVDPVRLDGSGAATRRPDDQLYIDGISIDDVEQGNIGDCYLIASIASLAHTNPSAIYNSIRDNQDGTYTVRLYDNGQARYITVDGDLYRYTTGNPIYARGTNPREVWMSIIEKAYAQMHGGYDKIGHGGRTANAIHALTGLDVATTRHNSSPKGKNHVMHNLYSDIDNAINNKQPVVASTYDSPSRYEQVGLIPNHAYSVMGVEMTQYGMHNRGRQYWVILRNPWADTEFGYPSTNTSPNDRTRSYDTDIDRNGDGVPEGDDGCFRMKLEDYMRLFHSTHIAQ